VEWFPPRLGLWVLQPLVDAGLTSEEIRDLVLRLGCDAVVHGEDGTVGSVQRLVVDRPAEVRDAWAVMLGRLLASDEATAGPAERCGS